jgi:uncharacterized lipoprotein YbaY
MNHLPQEVRKLTRAVLVLAAIVATTAASPPHLSAIDGQRLQTPNQEPPGSRAEQPAVRDRIQQNLIAPRPYARWTLGVRVANLQTGTRITDVQPSSAAWRVGLETRDVIVTVNGYQVGFVNRQLYDLQTELNLRAGRSGAVRLLVWNHRNGELVNIDVRLDRGRSPKPNPPRPDPPRGGIHGSITFRASLTSDKKAEIVVQLVDISDRLRGGKVVEEQRIPFAGEVPVSFHLDVKQAQLETHRRYQLKASLLVNGRRLLASQPGLYPVNRIDGREVAIELKPVRFDKR